MEAARFDLMHVNATLRLFELNEEAKPFPIHMDVRRLFGRSEIFRLCQAALAEAPEGLDTRDLAVAVIRAKGLDDRDVVLRKAVALKVISTLVVKCKRGQVADGGKRKREFGF